MKNHHRRRHHRLPKPPRCDFVGVLLSTAIGLLLASTVFLGQARSFRCQRTLLPSRGSQLQYWQHHQQHYGNAWRISQDESKSKPQSTVTALRTASTSTSTSTSTRESVAFLLESIIPEGTPMQQHGTPVGAVVLPGPSISSFHQECRKAFPDVKNLKFRGVENHHGPTPNAKKGDTNDAGIATMSYKAIHLQTEVAASLLNGDAPSLVEFIHNLGGHFLPGVRMTKDKPPKVDTPCPRADSRFTFVELFAGIGGFRLGLEPIGGSCVLASEKDEVACAFYRRHFGTNHESTQAQHPALASANDLLEGDVLDVVSDDFPEDGFDLLTAGFPCQPFSARGKKKGLDDDGQRGQMYQELVRILVDQQPPYFLFENVVGLVTMDGGRRVVRNTTTDSDSDSDSDSDRDRNTSAQQHFFEAGRTMEIVLKAFRSCGYKVEWHVVNCKYFCPQHRERAYFVGSRLDLDCPDMVWENIYPPQDDAAKPPLLRDFLEQDHLTNADIPACELTEQQWEMVQRKCNDNGGEATSTATATAAVKANAALTKLGLKIDEPSAPTLISSYRTPSSPSARFVTEEADGTLRHGSPLRPRFLTPTEFRRIMGFPDTFEVSSPIVANNKSNTNSQEERDGETENDSDSDGNVDGHAYKVLGNAVVPPVIEAIGREILRLKEEVEARNTRTQDSS